MKKEISRPDICEESRPWGKWRRYCSNKPVSVKTMIIKPGQRTSDQRHKFRSEFWAFHCGKVKVTLEEKGQKKEVLCQAGDELFVPVDTWHRIECLPDSSCATRFTEIAFDHYDEDDIERRSDDYGRV